MRVQSNEPKRREGTLLWDVEVRYSAELEEREEDEYPLARPAKISWSSAMYQRATLFDADKKVIQNAAGDLFDPQDVEDERWVISVKKNVAAVPKWILNYRMVVNDGNVCIQGRCRQVRFGDPDRAQMRIDYSRKDVRGCANAPADSSRTLLT